MAWSQLPAVAPAEEPQFEQGQRFEMIITHVEADYEPSLLKVWGQLDKKKKEQVDFAVYKYADSFSSGHFRLEPSNVCLGALCCVKFQEDNCWYRARVEELYSKGSLSLATVIFIDYGNCAKDVPVADLRQPITELVSCLGLASEFLLADLESVNQTWSEEALNFCEAQLCEEEVSAGVITHNHLNIPLIKVYLKDRPKVPFNRVLIDKGYGRHRPLHAVNVNFEVNEGRLADDEPVASIVFGFPPIKVVVGSETRVRVVLGIGIDNFFVRYVNHTDSSYALSDADLLAMSESCVSDGFMGRVTTESVLPGFACMAFNTYAGFYCRCLVVDANPISGQCRVLFVDFGNQDTVAMTEMRYLPDEYRRYPAQAIHCKFDRIQAENKDIEFLRGLLYGGEKIVTCRFHQFLGNSTYAVILSQGSIPELQVTYSYKKFPLRMHKDYIVEVSHIQHLNSFYVTLVESEPLRGCLTEKLKAISALEANLKKLPSDQFVAGAPCLVKCCERQCLFRGVIEATLNDRECMVKRVDIGLVEDYCMKDIFAISEDLVNFVPALAIHCYLMDVNSEPSVRRRLVQNMVHLVDGKHLKATILDVNNLHRYGVELHDITINPPLSINRRLQCVQVPSPVIVKQPCFERTEYISVTSYTSASRFFGQMLRFTNESMVAMLRSIDARYCSLKTDEKLLPVKGGVVTPGEYCCAPFLRHYYRARVTSHRRFAEKVEVFFVDYGNSEAVDMFAVKQLDADLAEHPAFGIECSIAENYTYVFSEIACQVKEIFLNKVVIVEITGINSEGICEVKIVDCPLNKELLAKLTTHGVTLWSENLERSPSRGPKRSAQPRTLLSPIAVSNSIKSETESEEIRVGVVAPTYRKQSYEESCVVECAVNGRGGHQTYSSNSHKMSGYAKSFNNNNDDNDGRGSHQDERRGERIYKSGGFDGKDSGYTRFIPPRMQRPSDGSNRSDNHGQSRQDESAHNWNQNGGERDDAGRDDDNTRSPYETKAVKTSDLHEEQETIELRASKIDVKKDNLQFVKVSYVESPNNFYCQLLFLTAEFDEMNAALQQHYGRNRRSSNSSGKRLSTAAADTPCCAMYSTDNQWCRASVVEVINAQKVRVRYVDFGNVEVKTLAELQPLTSEFCRVPMYAVQCSLSGIRPSSANQKWSFTRNADFEAAVYENTFVGTFVTARADVGYEIHLSKASFPTELSLNYEMLKEKAAYPSDPNDRIYKAMLYDGLEIPFPEPHLQFSQAEEVIVSWLVSLGRFFVQLCSTQECRDQLLATCLQQSRSAALLCDFSRNAPCIALYQDGGYEAWCRGVVIESIDTNAYVFFVDYGNIEFVSKKEVRCIDDELLSIPVQAIPCCFGGVEPLDRVWPMPTSNGENLSKYFRGGNIVCQFFGQTERGLQTVDFLVNGQLVVQLLITDGVLARSLMKSLPIGPVTVEVESDTYPPIEDLPDGLHETDVCSNDNPAFFWCRLTSVREIAERYSKEIDKSDLEDLLLGAPDCGKAVICERKGFFCRATVTQRLSSSKSQVFFVDHGDNATVNVDQLKCCSQSFMRLPRLAFPCTLSGCDSVDQENVPTCDRFTREVPVGAQVKAFVEQKSRGVHHVTLFRADEDEESGFVNLNVILGLTSSVDIGLLGAKGGVFAAVGDKMEVIVTACDSPNAFYIQRANEADELSAFIDSLNIAYNGSLPETLALDLALGSVHVALYSEDEQWYRASLMSGVDDQGFVNVVFVDYGNKETVSVDNIRKMKPEFEQVPYFAALCRLSVPSKDDQLSQDAISATMDDIFTNIKVVNAEFEARCDGKYVVKLSDGDMNLFSHLECSGTHAVVNGSIFSAVGEKLNVIVSHVNSPMDFYVQRVSDQDALASFLTEIYDACNETDDIEVNPGPGLLCVAREPLDENWYRAEVLSVDVDCVTVKFIDYGNASVVPLELLKKISSVLKERPTYAVHCQLHRLKPDEEFSLEMNNNFADLVLNATDLSAELVTSDIVTCAVVRLFDSEGNDVLTTIKSYFPPENLNGSDEGQRILDAVTPDENFNVLDENLCAPDANLSISDESVCICDENPTIVSGENLNVQVESFNAVDKCINVPDETVKATDESVELMSLKMADAIAIGHRAEVTVTCTVSPWEFWLQKIEDASKVDDILDLLQEEYEKSKWKNDHVFSVGEACTVKFSHDDQWYRAVVLDVTKSEGFLVRFVDFGNAEVVSPADIRRLSAVHLHRPWFAFECTLHGIVNDNDDVRSEEATAKFIELVGNTKLLAEVVAREDDGKCVVSLLNMGMDLAATLVQSGLVDGCADSNLHAILSVSDEPEDLREMDSQATASVESVVLEDSAFSNQECSQVYSPEASFTKEAFESTSLDDQIDTDGILSNVRPIVKENQGTGIAEGCTLDYNSVSEGESSYVYTPGTSESRETLESSRKDSFEAEKYFSSVTDEEHDVSDVNVSDYGQEIVIGQSDDEDHDDESFQINPNSMVALSSVSRDGEDVRETDSQATESDILEDSAFSNQKCSQIYSSEASLTKESIESTSSDDPIDAEEHYSNVTDKENQSIGIAEGCTLDYSSVPEGESSYVYTPGTSESRETLESSRNDSFEVEEYFSSVTNEEREVSDGNVSVYGQEIVIDQPNDEYGDDDDVSFDVDERINRNSMIAGESQEDLARPHSVDTLVEDTSECCVADVEKSCSGQSTESETDDDDGEQDPPAYPPPSSPPDCE